jgi:hypothetical protein
VWLKTRLASKPWHSLETSFIAFPCRIAPPPYD